MSTQQDFQFSCNSPGTLGTRGTEGHAPSASRIFFDGRTYEKEFDCERLTGQLRRVWNCMKDGLWRTLPEISAFCGDPEQSVSARLRDLRKQRFGGHTINRRARGERSRGNFEYQLVTHD